jgi:hypothetical protein
MADLTSSALVVFFLPEIVHNAHTNEDKSPFWTAGGTKPHDNSLEQNV